MSEEVKYREEGYIKFEIKSIEFIFRYFEYLIIVGGTFGIIHERIHNNFTAFLFYGSIFVLGYYAEDHIKLVINSIFRKKQELIFYVIYILMIFFNVVFVETLISVFSNKF